MLKRTAAAVGAVLVLAIGGTGAALAANGADDPAGHHQEHQGNGHKGKHHHHGRHHHHGQGDDHGKGNEPGDDNGGHGNEPGDDSGGMTEAPPAAEPGY
jgi:hypothetical protein